MSDTNNDESDPLFWMSNMEPEPEPEPETEKQRVKRLLNNLEQEPKTIELLRKIRTIVPSNKIHNIKEINKDLFSDDTVFDIRMYMDISMNEIEENEDEDLIFLYFEGQKNATIYPRKELKKLYNDYTYIFVSCKKLNNSAVNIQKVKEDNVFFQLNTQVRYFIPLEQMIELLSSKHKEWLIQPTNQEEEFTASILNVYDRYSGDIDITIGRNSFMHNIVKKPLNIVSGWHCQDGTKQKIFSITPIKFKDKRKIDSPVDSPEWLTINRDITNTQNKKTGRCPRGTIRNKRTGLCEKKKTPQSGGKSKKKRSKKIRKHK